MNSYDAIVLAAGKGRRMKAGENKQFIMLEGKPVILHSLTVFEQDPWCRSITLVINPKEEERIIGLLKSVSFSKAVTLVKGGAERQESVRKGLQNLALEDHRLVFIHDGARPFVSLDSLHRLAEAAGQHKAALLAVRVTDTIKQKKGDQLATLDRNTLWAAQTPQAFAFSIIKEAHQAARHRGFLGTDDASLVEELGKKVAIVEGSYQNIKITTPEDLGRAQLLLGLHPEKEEVE